MEMVDQSSTRSEPTQDELACEAIADDLESLAKRATGLGLSRATDLMFEAAATIDLALPHLQACWGGPFNGQHARRDLFLDLIERIKPIAIIETGTFRGITTGFMAERFSGAIYTVESNGRYYHQSKTRLKRFSHVHVFHEDSRNFLSTLSQRRPLFSPAFFYLDAHWLEDLPIFEEIEIIIHHWTDFVLMIDDFQVPLDSGYGFDDYGWGKRLSLESLAALRNRDLTFHFPVIGSSEETGAKRGTIVISGASTAPRVGASPLLRSANCRDWQLGGVEP
jgi:predicted O-methyltransferase YrrM